MSACFTDEETEVKSLVLCSAALNGGNRIWTRLHGLYPLPCLAVMLQPVPSPSTHPPPTFQAPGGPIVTAGRFHPAVVCGPPEVSIASSATLDHLSQGIAELSGEPGD